LDFDQLLIANQIDQKSIDLHFELIARSRVPLFQRGVQ
jgi:hypothetical protein